MKTKTFVPVLFSLLLLAALVFGTGFVSAQTQVYTLPWTVIAAGGMGGNAGNFELISTLGQPVAGEYNVGNVNMTSGFWMWLEEVIVEYFYFLPAIMR